MKVSLNTIKQFTDIDLAVDELVAKINEQLGSVEEVIDLNARYEDAIVVKIVSAEQHPNADRLKVCLVDDAGIREDVERDENGLVQVVCGAPNARAGIFAVWLPPKSTVPSSYNDKELFVLESRELRGVISHGMLAAADELAIGSDHEGILEIDPEQWKPGNVEIKPGASFAEAYGLNDTIIDIENKMFTHRPDLFGQIGVAREIAGIQQHAFTSPNWYSSIPEFSHGEGLELEVVNEATGAVPRFMSVAMKDVEIKPSPLWLQCELVRLGSKPINNIVDVTNYVMLLTAQPTHVYDYDKIRGHKIVSRMAVKDEKVTLLNGKTYALSEDDIVIADAEGPIGLGGVMGGGDSEIDENTKNIVLEVASFDMYTVRKTSMRYGIFTDALTRFNKGQSPRQNPHVMNLLMSSIKDVAGGEQASAVNDKSHEPHTSRKLRVSDEFISTRLGADLSVGEITQLLNNVEIETHEVVDGEKKIIELTVPFWRTDLELGEDIVEEVGRLYGFDKLPRELPIRTIKPVVKNAKRELETTLRNVLSRGGANEVLTYSFVHEKLLKNANQDPAQAYTLSNALSPDLHMYRLSITPSLLDKVHANIRAGHDEFALFEIGKGHNAAADKVPGELPSEQLRIGFTYASKQPKDGAAYYVAKRHLDIIGRALGLAFEYKALPAETAMTIAAPFDQTRCARVIDTNSEQPVAIIGEYADNVSAAFKLPNYAAGFEILTEGLLLALQSKTTSYKPLSKYPSTERDICFQVAATTMYKDVVSSVKTALAPLEISTLVTPVDIFSQTDIKKNITIRIKLTSHLKTLSQEEIQSIIEKVSSRVVTTIGATLV